MPDQPDAPTTISVPAAVLLGVAVTATTTLAVIIAIQGVFPSMRVYEGTTALLASLTALAGTGVIICAVGSRLMRRLDQLDEKVSAQRVAYLPQSAKAPGVRHLASVVEPPRVGLDSETIAAARSLARQIVDGPAKPQRDAE